MSQQRGAGSAGKEGRVRFAGTNTLLLPEWQSVRKYLQIVAAQQRQEKH